MRGGVRGVSGAGGERERETEKADKRALQKYGNGHCGLLEHGIKIVERAGIITQSGLRHKLRDGRCQPKGEMSYSYQYTHQRAL
jgi:hypothetical protein